MLRHAQHERESTPVTLSQSKPVLSEVEGGGRRGLQAQAEVAEVLRINPQFSLEVHKQRAPIKDPAVLKRHIAALRKAGLK